MSAVIKPLINVRPMQREDLDDIMVIEQQVYEFPWTQGIFRDCMRVGYQCTVLEHRDRLAGYCVMSSAVGESHVLNVSVDQPQQGMGFGRILLEHMIETAYKQKSEVVLLEVRPSNRAALHLYHKLGFNEVGIRKEYYPADNGREDALILARTLLPD
jgi:ribosomal-protein-alanine N-acetyltransferase